MRARLLLSLLVAAYAGSASAQQSAQAKDVSRKIEALPQGAVKMTLSDVQRAELPAVAPAPSPPIDSGASAGTAVTPTAPSRPPTSATTAVPAGSTGAGGPRPTVRPARVVQLPLALEGVPSLDASELKLISTQQAGVNIRSRDGGEPVLEVPVNGRAIVSSEAGKQSAERDPISVERKTALPWLVIETEREGSRQSVRTARPFLTLAKAISWNAQARRHMAEFLFGLDPEGGEAGAMQHPVEARFAVSCDDVQPALARVEKIGPGGYGSVRVSCSPAVKNEQRQQFLAIHVEQGSLRYPFDIPRRPGPLRLLASALSVPGFGFGTLALTGEQLEEDGSPLQAAQANELQLSADRSGLDVSAVKIAAGASSGTVEVHPRGVGPLAVTLVHGTLRSPPLMLERMVPWLALLSMIAGGTLGGVLFLFGPRPKRDGTTSLWRKHPMLRRAVEGTLVGVLVTALVLILPSVAAIPEWARTTELGLFVVAAFAGFLGTPLLDRVARLLFPALERGTGS